MRPMGEISLKMLEALALGPAPVRELAQRAQVGFDVARYTATRLVERGAVVRLEQCRPAVLALPGQSFWEAANDERTPLGQVTEDSFACL